MQSTLESAKFKWLIKTFNKYENLIALSMCLLSRILDLSQKRIYYSIEYVDKK